MERTYIQHWGIKGMKWGVRRYQNKDGSLTPAGEKRYTRMQDRERKEEMRQAVKNRRLLSDEEIERRIKRIKLEKELRTLTDEELNKGKLAVEDVLTDSGKQYAKTILTGSMKYATKAALKKKFSLSEAADYIAPKPKK